MTDSAKEHILQQIRQALGRTQPLQAPPVPPPLDEPITRLVHMAIGLGELFAKRAQQNHMHVEPVYVEQLLDRVLESLKTQNCRIIAIPPSAFLDQLSIYQTLKDAGFDVRRTTELTLDQMHQIDCAITDVYCAVAEVGGLVFRAEPGYPRSLSLIPPVHIAILQPADFVPDLVDLFEKIHHEGAASELAIITGPAQTTDLGLKRMFGLQGPRLLQAFILR